MKDSAPKPVPMVSVDCVICTVLDDRLSVLLVQRSAAPFRGAWALPGGSVHSNESLEDAARRTLADKTGLSNVYLEQLYTFGKPDRDPRGRVITVAYYALIDWERRDLKGPAFSHPSAGSNTVGVGWFSVKELPEPAFDHKEIIEMALERLRGKLEYSGVGFELLPPKFTLSELQHVYEIILDRELDKRNFRKKIKQMDQLVALNEKRMKGVHRPAQLYSFKRPEPKEG